MRMTGKVALVTGASKGIGAAIAEGLAREGAQVVVHYGADADGARAVVDRIGSETSWAIGADLRSPDEIEAMLAAVRERHERLDALINNAAVTGWTPLFDTTPEQWDAVIETNLRGTFFCSLGAARVMRDQGGGAIVNVSSNCAARGVKNLVAYASSKGGIHAMTVQLAVELAPYQIRVNTFAPGPTEVARNLRDDPNYGSAWAPLVPLGRAASPEEMVGPAVFLASEDSSYVTGQIFYADGGWTVQGQIPTEQLDAAARRHASRPTDPPQIRADQKGSGQ